MTKLEELESQLITTLKDLIRDKRDLKACELAIELIKSKTQKAG